MAAEFGYRGFTPNSRWNSRCCCCCNNNQRPRRAVGAQPRRWIREVRDGVSELQAGPGELRLSHWRMNIHDSQRAWKNLWQRRSLILLIDFIYSLAEPCSWSDLRAILSANAVRIEPGMSRSYKPYGSVFPPEYWRNARRADTPGNRDGFR